MTDRQAKPVALKALRRRFDTARFALEWHIEANMNLFLRDSPDDAHNQAVAWLAENGFGPIDSKTSLKCLTDVLISLYD